MQKAIGWMLREMGKRDKDLLIQFLEQYNKIMPRTTLRYAIEKFPEEERKEWMSHTTSVSGPYQVRTCSVSIDTEMIRRR